MRLRVNGEWHNIQVGDIHQSPVDVVIDGEVYLVELEAAVEGTRPRAVRARQHPKVEQPGLRAVIQGNDKLVRCPLPGKVVLVSVTKGQALEPGDEICVLESMKMEQSVRMAHHGVVKGVKIKKEQNVTAGTALLELQ